ncbi:5'-nucleotidase C-terminal domain-containing protein [Staphylococcus aureus]
MTLERVKQTQVIADAMEAYGVARNSAKKTDFAVTNGGGIRASIAKGKVTRYKFNLSITIWKYDCAN